MFVDRVNGAIVALYAVRQHPDQEEIADNHADVAAFRESIAMPRQLTPAQKLKRMGLTVADLKALLQS